MNDERALLEHAILDRCARGDHAGAARAIVDGYGPELARFLAARTRGPDHELAEVFAAWCEDVVRGLPGFRGASSVRTWLYVIARHAAAQHARAARRRRDRELPADLAERAAAIPTRTASYLRTAVRDRLTVARAGLPADDQELLVLRVDQQLPWRTIAEILAEGALDAAALDRREAALRKRFEGVKRRLKAALVAAGCARPC